MFTLSAPDGFIFISKGLLKKCRNEDELAFLLAKEISHIVWNDPVNSIEKPVIHEINKAFREKKSGLPDREALKNAFSLLLDSVSKNLQNGFPEEINVRAFKMAIDILIKTGYSVKAAVSILNQIDFDSQYAKMNSDLEKIKAENNVIIIKLAASSVKIIDTARSNRFLAFKKKLQ